MVSGVRCFSVTDCVGHSKSEAFFQKQAGKVSLDGDAIDGCRRGGATFHAAWRDCWIQPGAAFVPSAHSDDCRGLHHLGRGGEGGFLQTSEIVTFEVRSFGVFHHMAAFVNDEIIGFVEAKAMLHLHLNKIHG